MDRVGQLNEQDSGALQADLRQLQTHIEQLFERMANEPDDSDNSDDAEE
jgi:hypothetical protein